MVNVIFKWLIQWLVSVFACTFLVQCRMPTWSSGNVDIQGPGFFLLLGLAPWVGEFANIGRVNRVNCPFFGNTSSGHSAAEKQIWRKTSREYNLSFSTYMVVKNCTVSKGKLPVFSSVCTIGCDLAEVVDGRLVGSLRQKYYMNSLAPNYEINKTFLTGLEICGLNMFGQDIALLNVAR